MVFSKFLKKKLFLKMKCDGLLLGKCRLQSVNVFLELQRSYYFHVLQDTSQQSTEIFGRPWADVDLYVCWYV